MNDQLAEANYVVSNLLQQSERRDIVSAPRIIWADPKYCRTRDLLSATQAANYGACSHGRFSIFA